MFGYIVRRIVAGIAVILVVMVASFFLFFLGPSQPEYSICGNRNCTPDRLADIRRSLSLDKPVPEQFAEFFTGIVTGREIHSGGFVKKCDVPCLGYSFVADQPVTTMIVQGLPVTISVALGAMVIFTVFGVTTGALAAIHRGTLWDKTLVSGSMVLTSFPYYLVALLAAIYLTIQYQVLPRSGYEPLLQNPLGWFKGLLLPWVVLGAVYATSYARYTRAAMVEALGEDFVRTARAKGLTVRKVNFKHALRAGLTSVVTILGLDLANLLTGTVFTEQIFNVQGLGLIALNAFGNGDLPVIMGSVLYASFLLVALNIVVDIVYSFLDPRVRLG
ncbi:ABC transporter permease [Actinopolymorpha singaporensis]|uniref:Peptide/nickel transport system permease protein n=1 Tax=Actinopolymorpha singaporensis TaxID=117157 RepID=A0A1H1VHP4_9ACTN|nr:ABC transporter permease [Actinopolymorpha singaporensis]SDS84272.1 peptide/nickel transport system permease protein [Actinopolymorpha singaporensis]